MSSGFPRRAWIGATTGLTLLFWIADLAHPTYVADGGWFLQITERAGDGDLPYRDFFMGVLPLPLWLNLAATELFGTEIAVQKLLIVAAQVGGALLAARIALSLGVSRVAAGLVLLASLASFFLPTAMPYAPLSYLFLLATLAAVLAWRRAAEAGATSERRTRWLLAGAGALAGASLAGKHTVGAAAVLALLACVVAWSPRPGGEWRGRLADTAIVSGAAAAVAVVVLIPVALGGGLDEFRFQAFEKGEYVANSEGSYVDGLKTFFEELARGGWTLLRLNTVFLAPVLAALALAVAALRSPRSEFLPVALFTAAAVLPALPRAFYFNVAYTVPLCAIAVAAAWPAIAGGEPEGGRRWASPRARRIAAAALAALLVGITALNLVREPIRTASEDAEIAGLDHYEGTLFPFKMLKQAREQNDELRAADAEGDVFILAPFSGFLYLVSGVENPTRHDYAARDSMRAEGEEEVLDALRTGEIERVCLGSYAYDPDQRLERLEAWVTTEMKKADRWAFDPEILPPWQCTIYKPRGEAAAR